MAITASRWPSRSPPSALKARPGFATHNAQASPTRRFTTILLASRSKQAQSGIAIPHSTLQISRSMYFTFRIVPSVLLSRLQPERARGTERRAPGRQSCSKFLCHLRLREIAAVTLLESAVTEKGEGYPAAHPQLLTRPSPLRTTRRALT